MYSGQSPRKIATVALAVTLTAATAGTAFAAPSPDDEVASLISRVAPDQGSVLQGVEGVAGTQIAAGEMTISIPDSPADAVSIDGPRNDDFSISLPTELNLENGSTAADGTVVYNSADADSGAAVQALDDGSVRMQTVIPDAGSTHEFTYNLEGGFAPAEAEDGSMWAIGLDNAGDPAAYSIETAWARDANGNDVPTRYEIRGESIVQVVTPNADTAYPIVADPRWAWYAFAYGAKFNKDETRGFASIGSVAGFCGLLGGGAGIACGVLGAQWWAQAGIANNEGKCLFIATVPAPLGLVYDDDDCN